MLIHAIDYFARPRFGDNSNSLYKARLLVGTLYAFIFICLIFTAYVGIFSPLTLQAKILAQALLVPICLFYVVCLIWIRERGFYERAAQAVVASSYTGITAGVAISGGPVETPAGMMLVMPCILAFSLLGARAGLAWTLVMFLTNIAGIIAHVSGFHFMQVSPPELEETTRIYNWILAFCAIIALVIIYEQMNTRLKRELDEERQRYKHMATHDMLTGLANRKLFHEMLSLSIARASRNKYTVSLLMIDLNGFKPINDTLGHEAGDKMLVHVAKNLNHCIRRTDLAARLGGDEFAVILEGFKNEDDLVRVVEKVRQAIATPLERLSLSVSGSVGVSIYPDHTQLEEELIRFADHSMYFAKKNGLDYKLYAPEVDAYMESLGTAREAEQ